ncbi:Oidioi.mRNA.OKI2018_I69.XSR.g16747.t1.cds [Oikopleura dioica]|uniref:peptidylprolyl isomerase n=1 Tax=Oikopleura dioica TaxID=34765 RepID=A0ABN7SL32_OIKDI|nr:Oidioi.mRNA.OKI2018_I69.XSR.g16747.t1.cds [Oikopleura dioica]
MDREEYQEYLRELEKARAWDHFLQDICRGTTSSIPFLWAFFMAFHIMFLVMSKGKLFWRNLGDWVDNAAGFFLVLPIIYDLIAVWAYERNQSRYRSSYHADRPTRTRIASLVFSAICVFSTIYFRRRMIRNSTRIRNVPTTVDGGNEEQKNYSLRRTWFKNALILSLFGGLFMIASDCICLKDYIYYHYDCYFNSYSLYYMDEYIQAKQRGIKTFTTKVKISHIVVKHSGSRNPSTADLVPVKRNRQQAREKLELIKAETTVANFDVIAEKYSDCTTRSSGGDCGWIFRGDSHKVVEDVAFNLNIGQLRESPSSPIKT